MSQHEAVVAPKQSAMQASGILQRECSDCRKKRPLLQRRAVRQAEPETVPPIVHEGLSSPGQPLDAKTREFMEPRFGQDFSMVQVHTDASAAETTQAFSARAITLDNHIFLSQKQSAADRPLIAHELAHVTQQRLGSRGMAAEPHETELEAHIAASTVGKGGLVDIHQPASSGMLQLSALSDDVNVGMQRGGKGEVFNILRARGPITPADADLSAWLDAHLGPNTDPATMTDDRWLADQIVRYGAEPRWPLSAITRRQQLAQSHQWNPEQGNIEATFNVGVGRIPVRAYYFPGTSERRAMIIGGVHGSEAAGVEVVNILLERMRTPGAPIPYFSVIIVPVLFPENLAGNRRKTTPRTRDPNRQMPAVGATPGTTDTLGDPIEPENLVLLDLIERFQPERIASSHGHLPPRPRGTDMPSITSDPRPGREQEDEALALEMARRASRMPGGARVPGNRLGTPQETAFYPTSSAPHEPGVTFGEYASHAAGTRPAMNVITIETYDNYTSTDPRRSERDRRARRIELESIAAVLRDIFLGPTHSQMGDFPEPRKDVSVA